MWFVLFENGCRTRTIFVCTFLSRTPTSSAVSPFLPSLSSSISSVMRANTMYFEWESIEVPSLWCTPVRRTRTSTWTSTSNTRSSLTLISSRTCSFPMTGHRITHWRWYVRFCHFPAIFLASKWDFGYYPPIVGRCRWSAAIRPCHVSLFLLSCDSA